MKAPPRQVAQLVGLTTILVGVIGYQVWNLSPADSDAVPAPTQSAANPLGSASAVQVTDVKLEALVARRDGASASTRDPFRYRMKPPPPAPPPPPVVPPPPQQGRGRGRGPDTPSVERITLKYLGFALGPGGTRMAVLHDGSTRPPLLGKQGDVLEGRYRLLRVEADNVEVAYLDGTGRLRIGKGQ